MRYSLRHTDSEAQCAAHESHDGVKGREDDGDDQEDQDGGHPDDNLHDAPEVRGPSDHGGRALGDGLLVQTQQHFSSCDNRPRVQWDLGQWDDGDDGTEKVGHGTGIPFRQENVGRDGVHDVVAEHEEADDGHGHVQEVGEGEGDFDGAGVLVRVAHIAVHVGKHAVAAPGAGEKTEREGQSEPVGGEEVGLGRLDEGAWAFWFDEAIDDDDGNNCRYGLDVSASAHRMYLMRPLADHRKMGIFVM